ncbi:MAG: MarR family winged helix-turn-helix transcriptional regulator [Actinobacteria bacterium]|nr:MarR family winged helix-turn-helix transcriptional regulator [Actinomycetota bacterium]
MTGKSEHEELVAAIIRHVRALALVSEHIGQAFAAGQGLHPTDFRALSLIYEADRADIPLTPLALAHDLGLSPGAVTYSIDRLAASGHVRRERDERDGRRVILRIASHGHQVATDFFGPLGRAHAVALASYSDTELRTCERFLGDLVRTVADFQPEMPSHGDS